MEWRKLRQIIQLKRREALFPNSKVWYDLYHDHIISTLDGTTDDMLFYVRHGTPKLSDPNTLLEFFRVESTQKPDFSSRMKSTILRRVLVYTSCGASKRQTLSQCLSTIEGAPTYFERKHVTENSFTEENRPFLDHPVSTGQSELFWDHSSNAHILTAAEALKAKLFNQMVKESPSISRTSSKGYSKTDPIVFLTEKELDLAQENVIHRYKDILKNDNPLLNERRDIDPKLSKDSGLEWLFESDVTFVDCSESATNQERYIVTRQRDGTLYHNNHEERDSINGSFFPHNFQQYPPADVFECDKTFDHAVNLGTVDTGTLLDMLERSYSLDHPVYHRRHLQLAKMVFDQPEMAEQVIFSRHFVPLVMRGLHEKLNTENLVEHLRKTGREEIANGLLDIYLSMSPRSLRSGLTIRPKTVIIINGWRIKSERNKDTSIQEDLALKVAKACQIDRDQVVKCTKYEEFSIIARLRSAKLANKLHNNGQGAIISCDKREFLLFADLISTDEKRTNKSRKQEGRRKVGT